MNVIMLYSMVGDVKLVHLILQRKDIFVKPWLVVEALAILVNIGSTIYGAWLLSQETETYGKVNM